MFAPALPPTPASAGRAVATVAALALATLVGLTWTHPPAPRPATAPPETFSAQRAAAHVAAVAARPHRVGSAEAERVRAYLVERLQALGLATEIQETIGRGPGHRLARVHNVVARRPGAAPSGKAVLLVCHHDTRSMTPGAADDAVGVAAVLEALRALGSGPAVPADVIALFTDAEEEGLIGARAFVSEHRWARDIGVALNFEARGNAGPAHVFQTSDGNGALVRTLARAVPVPVASSLSRAVYRLLPNDTDLSVFLPQTPALDIANIGGLARYHAPTDTPEHLDLGTLQQQGELALALTREFAAGPLPPPREPDATYFDAGPVFVRYPEALALPLVAIATLLLVAFVAIAARARALRLAAVAVALPTAAVVALAAAAATGALYRLAALAHPTYAQIAAARPALGALHLASALAVAAGLSLGVQRLLARRLSTVELFAGGAALFVLLSAIAVLALPGAAFLFTWPAITALLGGLALLHAGGLGGEGRLALALRLATPLPAVALVAPFVPQLSDAFGPPLTPVPVLLAALLWPLCAPLLEPSLRLTGGAFAAATALGFAAWTLPAFDADHPQPDTLIFAVDGDRGQGAWVSPDPAPDPWTGRVLGPSRGAWPLPFPLAEAQSLLRRDVGPVTEPAPTITWTTPDEVHVVAPPGAEVIAVQVEGPVHGLTVAGHRVGTSFRFHAPPPGGLHLTLAPHGPGPITVRVLSQRPGFPADASPPGPRPPGWMAKPGMLPPWDDLLESDMTLVARTSTRRPSDHPGAAE